MYKVKIVEDCYVDVGTYEIVVYKHGPEHGSGLPALSREECLELADKIYERFGVDRASEAFLRGVEDGRAAH